MKRATDSGGAGAWIALVVLPPSQTCSICGASEFSEQLLRDGCAPARLVEGGVVNFGKGRGGNLRPPAGVGGRRPAVGLRIVEPVRPRCWTCRWSR